jgi:hypothetical protein
MINDDYDGPVLALDTWSVIPPLAIHLRVCKLISKACCPTGLRGSVEYRWNKKLKFTEINVQ